MKRTKTLLQLSALSLACATVDKAAPTGGNDKATAAPAAAPAAAGESEFRPLWNSRDLSGWEPYLGPPQKGEAPLGANNDPRGVFSVVSEDGEPAIRVSGEIFGALTTTGEHENYHLRVEYKWGEKRWPPRENTVRDSGILYHAVLPFETNTGWMRSFECQVEEHDTGDYWGVKGAIADVRVRPMDDSDERRRAFDVWRERNGVKGPAVAYDPGGTVTTIRKGGLMKSHDNERPGWNTVDVYCVGDVSVHAVNGGAPNMVLTGLRQPTDAGGEAPLIRGKIQLQSEGAEVFYRRIQIRPMKSLPAGLGRTEK